MNDDYIEFDGRMMHPRQAEMIREMQLRRDSLYNQRPAEMFLVGCVAVCLIATVLLIVYGVLASIFGWPF